MRKPDFGYAKTKAQISCANQLRGNHATDQRLCFHYIDSTIPLLPKSEIYKFLAIFCHCTAWFVSDLVGNPKDRFSHDAAQSGSTATGGL